MKQDTNVGRSGLDRQDRLRRREHERLVDRDPVGGELARGLETRGRERHLHDHAVVERRERTPLGDHLARVVRDDLGRGRPVHQLADAPDGVARVTLLLGEQRGVGGRAREHSPGRDLLDLGHRSGVDEQLH
jgi:hypothetical protein